nr:MAG TPA: hypothetical protein [Caudoviricetes sp.]
MWYPVRYAYLALLLRSGLPVIVKHALGNATG